MLLLPYSGTRTLLFPDVRIPLRKRYHGRFTDKSFVEKYIQARLSFRAILSKVLLSWFFTNMQRDGFFTNMQQDGLYVKGRVCRLDLVIWKFITPWCSLRWFTVIEIIILSNNTIEQMDFFAEIFFKIYNCYIIVWKFSTHRQEPSCLNILAKFWASYRLTVDPEHLGVSYLWFKSKFFPPKSAE